VAKAASQEKAAVVTVNFSNKSEAAVFLDPESAFDPTCTLDCYTRVYPKVSRVCNEIYAYNNKQSLRRNKKGYGGETH
jgi:hypothetical protein